MEDKDFIERLGDSPNLGDLVKVMSEITSALDGQDGQTVGEVIADVRKVVLIGALLLATVAHEAPSVILAALAIDAATAEIEREKAAAAKISNQALWN